MTYFHSGFVYECDDSARLTIEGRPMELITPKARQSAARLPSGETIEADTLHDLVDSYVTKSGALAKRIDTRNSQMERLVAGKDAWNKWRLADPDLHPMFAGADLTDFARARLGKTRGNPLDGYDFSYTNFTGANLSGLFLRGANFHQAILAKANCSGAHFEDANFCRTDLYETDFRGAYFTGANLQGVQLAKTANSEPSLRSASGSGCFR